MKEIKAIIKPLMLDHVLDALSSIEGLPGVTITNIVGWGYQTDEKSVGKHDAGHAFAKRTQLEVVIPDALVDAVVAAIQHAACTGHTGDGKIFVLDVLDALKVHSESQEINSF